MSIKKQQEIIKNNSISDHLINELADKVIKERIEPTSIIKPLMGKLLQKILDKEMEAHLGYSKYQRGKKNNYRNGYYNKTVKSDMGELYLSIPRDRNGEFEPLIIPKNHSVLGNIQYFIINLYSRGLSIYDIKEYLYDTYALVLSESQISDLIDDIKEEVDKWKNRELEKVYPIIYIDAIHMSIKIEGKVKKIPVYFIMGYNINGYKDLLGMYIISDNESSRDWLEILNDIKNRGVETIGIIVTDNLKGITNAIKGVYPEADIQKCVVHQVRNSLNKVSWKNRKELAKDMKKIYTASNEKEAEEELLKFGEKWGNKAPLVVRSWENNWKELKTFLKYPNEVRKLIYTTNPIESLNSQFRKYTKIKTVLPNQESAMKILYLAMGNIVKKWTRPVVNWGITIHQLNVFKNGIFDKYLT